MHHRAGQGATATVWRGEHRRLGVPVAIKIIAAPGERRPGSASTRDATEAVHHQFAREVRAVARLDHPGIVRVHDHGRLRPAAAEALGHRAGAPYLVMQWCHGGTLAERCGRMPWTELRPMLLAVLDALALAHAHGVIHRDLKPGNVLLDGGRPVVADFGLGFEAIERPDGPHLAWGTPGYMAPEQLRGAWWRFGPGTDLYALGCTAWALATGRSPFYGADARSVGRRQLDHRPAPFEPVIAVPPGFEGWLRWLFAPDPGGRPRFAAAAAEALAALPDAAGPPTAVAPSPGPWPMTLPATMGPAIEASPACPPARAPHPTVDPGTRLPDCGRSLAELRDPRLRGRDALEAALWRIFGDVVETRRPAAVILEGTAGLGKTRLALWLTRRAHRAGAAEGLLATHQPDPGPTCGLGPMLARHLRVDGLPPDARAARLIDACGSPADAAALAAALDPSGEGEVHGHRVRLPNRTTRRPILMRALRRLAAGHPRIVIIDDARWGAEAVALVARMLDHGRDPLLFVLTARPAERGPVADLVGRPEVHRLSLAPLSASAIAGIVADRVALDRATRERLIDHVRGNPAFADELVRHWLEADLLVPGPTGHRLREDAPVQAGPGALWRARIERAIAPAHAGPCELAAVLGVAVDGGEWRAACAAAGIKAPADAVERLFEASLARPSAHDRWRFVHGGLRATLIRHAEAAGRAARWHRACAAALARRSGVDPRRIATHHSEAGDLEAAFAGWMTAWRHTRRRGAPDEGRRCLMQAISICRRLGERPDGPRWNRVRVWWALLSTNTGAIEPGRRHAERALAHARRRGDRAGTAWALVMVSQSISNVESVRAIELLHEAGAVHPDPAKDPDFACTRLRWLADQLLFAGDGAGARAALGEAERWAEGFDGEERAYVQMRRAEMAQIAGDLEAAERSAREAAAAFEASGDRFGLAHVAMTRGLLARQMGRFAEGVAALRTARDAFAVLGHRNVAVAECNLAQLLLDSGDPEGARRAAERGRARAIEMDDEVYRVFADLTLLPRLAAGDDRAAWDASWAAITELVPRLGLMLVDAAEALAAGAEQADAAGWPRRAAAAHAMAAEQFEGCGEPARAAEARRRAGQ